MPRRSAEREREAEDAGSGEMLNVRGQVSKQPREQVYEGIACVRAVPCEPCVLLRSQGCIGGGIKGSGRRPVRGSHERATEREENARRASGR